MELLVISHEKIKIMLCADDMKKYDLNANSLDYNMEKTKEAIKEILQVAKTRTGFEIDCDRMFIQAFPCRDGGCELYVSKLSNSSISSPKEEESDMYITACFTTLSELLVLCDKISVFTDLYHPSVYYDKYKNVFLLYFKMSIKSREKRDREVMISVIKEFCNVVTVYKKEVLFAEERYSCLCERNTFELLGRLKNEFFTISQQIK
jgi:negative regulator of genetic competence, sporulation and motility